MNSLAIPSYFKYQLVTFYGSYNSIFHECVSTKLVEILEPYIILVQMTTCGKSNEQKM